MSNVPAFPAGTLLDIQAVGFFPAASFAVSLRALDAFRRGCARGRFLVLPPGAPAHDLPPGRVCLVSLSRGGPARALRVRQAALMQKLARRAAEVEMGSAAAVADVYGSFHDVAHGWCGHIVEWIEGRYWRMEMTDRLFERARPSTRPELDDPALFQTEFEAKRLFMARLERLLRRLGAPAWARLYRWSTWISQRNVLKRAGLDDDPHAGWTAVRFPESRFDLQALREYMEERREAFETWRPLQRELENGRPPEAGRVIVHPSAPSPPAPALHLRRNRLRWFWHLLFRPEVRSANLLEKVQDGLNQHMLTPAEAEHIRRQIHDPMLQTYLVCLAVHLAMLPVTNLAVLAAAWWYSIARDLSFAEGARLAAMGMAFFAVAPLSPGSLARGLFVLGVALHRRSLKGLKIALALSFWRYVGYTAFPLQMISAYPALARYLAARGATHAVRIIPVLGRPGCLLEHVVFDLTFNLPLTLRRRWRIRRAARNAESAGMVRKT